MDVMTPDTATHRVTTWLAAFGDALEHADADRAAKLFVPDCYWRDLVSFTWNITTMEGRDAVAAMLHARLHEVMPSHWQVDGTPTTADGVTEAWITFETTVARGRAHLRLTGDGCFTLLTTMTELKGFEEPTGTRRPRGTEHGVVPGRKSWAERRAEETDGYGTAAQPYVLVIGGGQAGLTLGARLKRLGVPALIVEKNERAGDSWRNRYKSLCLHDPVWYDHLPYMPFPDHWPVFAPKDKIGDWLEFYARAMELDVWTSSEVLRATYDDAAQVWDVTVRRGEREVSLRPEHLVFATGVSGFANTPDFPGMDRFQGAQVHSSRHTGGEDFSGRRAVVIGSNNSAHDICADLWEHGADVTMVQRTSTHIMRSDTLMDLALGGLYSEQALANGVTTDMADLIFASLPYRILHTFQIPVYEQARARDAAFYERLERAGFLLDFGDDGSGLFMKYLRRGSGYYIDVGASELVANGSVKLLAGVSVTEVRERSVLFSDGTELPADLIVYATGYGSMNQWVAKIVSPETANRVGKCWGLGSDTTKDPGPWEGELRNMWKPTQVDGLWFMGGNLHQCRHYSLVLALQLKARLEAIPTPVYKLAPVHHAR